MPTAKKSATLSRPIVSKPQLLVLHEKHGNLYFHIKNDKVLFAIALDVLTNRLKSGYWYHNPTKYDFKSEVPEISRAEAEALQEGGLKTLALEKVRAHERRQRDRDNELREWADLKKAVETKSGRLAWQVLKARSDHEYERISLEKYDTEYYEFE
jgi:hypothetical protein